MNVQYTSEQDATKMQAVEMSKKKMEKSSLGGRYK